MWCRWALAPTLALYFVLAVALFAALAQALAGFHSALAVTGWLATRFAVCEASQYSVISWQNQAWGEAVSRQ